MDPQLPDKQPASDTEEIEAVSAEEPSPATADGVAGAEATAAPGQRGTEPADQRGATAQGNAGPGDTGPGDTGGAPSAAPTASVGRDWVPPDPATEPAAGSEAPATRKAAREAAKSKRTVWIAVAGVAALAVVLAVVIVLVGRGKEEPPAEPPTPVVVTKTVAPPSPTVTAVPPPGSTPFAQALPTAVGAYALTRAAEFPNWADAGAIEAYALTYSDGETEIRVTAGQWPTAEAAASAMEAAPLSTDTSGDKWQNETAIFTVDAPPEAAEAFAAQFPM